MAGTLYIVATPIGNLGDITVRALKTLSEVDLVAAEDTRHTRKLLSFHNIPARLASYHEHNERSRAESLLGFLKEGKSIALVSNAGTPLVSDPGYHIVRRCLEEGIDVVPIPGPSSVIAALSASGLPNDSFYFAGFPPAKKGRKGFFERLVAIPSTIILLESPYRVVKTLGLMQQILGDRNVVIARELTKVHEEFLRGRLSELIPKLTQTGVRGELVILVDRTPSEKALTAGS